MQILNDKSLIDVEDKADDVRIIMSGKTWSLLRQYFPTKVPLFVRNGAVFARMTSSQKQQLVLELQKLGYYVG